MDSRVAIRIFVTGSFAVVAACSGADPTTSRVGNSTVAPSNPSAAAGAGATGPAAPGTGFGNASNPTPQTAHVDAGQAQGTTPVVKSNGPVNIDDCASNPAGLNPTDTQTLLAGGAPGKLRWLYPYDGTVFPRGILPPSLMWDGVTGAQYVFVHIQAQAFEYKGCFKPSVDGRIDLSDTVWTKAGEQTKGTTDPFKVELTVMAGGVASGPISETWTIAQATIKGSIYYNSYASKLAASGPMGGGFGGGNGAVLRIAKGKSAEVFVNAEGCTACHTVSASGDRIVAHVLGGGGLFGGTNTGASYPVTPTSTPNPSPLQNMLANAAFPAISPDGALFVTNAHQNGVGARAGGPGMVGDPDSKVFQTDTGTEVTGTAVPATAMTPMFAPDGTLLAFNDYAIDNGHGLALQSFDQVARKASDYRMVFKESDANMYPAWPFFLPDNRALVFAIGGAADFSGMGAFVGGGAGGTNMLTPDVPKSDLYILDLASGSTKLLAKAMGFASDADVAGDKTYLPFGAAEELHHHYYPTVAPVPAGGYYWVFFDSIRHYGNRGLQRQLWGTAVDVSADGMYTNDPSHPAFYLTGQEDDTGNHRAFAALDPCMKDGDSCTSGTDCCGGYCFVGDKMEFEAVGSCTSHPPSCSKTGERCTTAGDCCPPMGNEQPNLCIAGFCAMVPPVQ